MNALALAVDAPDWVVAEMPPGYQTRIAEIQRLSEELQGMTRYAQLLWAVGPELREPVRDAFAALKYEADLLDAHESAVAARLDGQRRLLIHVSSAEDPLDRKSGEFEHVFRLLHQVADERDRVVLVTNCDRMRPPTDRIDPLTAEAARLLQRMGVNTLTAPVLFRLWALGSHNAERARKFVGQLYDQDGGPFTVPS